MLDWYYLHEVINIFSVSDDGNFNGTTCIADKNIYNAASEHLLREVLVKRGILSPLVKVEIQAKVEPEIAEPGSTLVFSINLTNTGEIVWKNAKIHREIMADSKETEKWKVQLYRERILQPEENWFSSRQDQSNQRRGIRPENTIKNRRKEKFINMFM